MNNVDLSLVSIDEIIDELNKRYDHFIFSGIQVRGEDDLVTRRSWKGNSATCQGLCFQTQYFINKEVFDNEGKNKVIDEGYFED